MPDDTRRAALLAQAAALPAGVATPDSLLFGEGFDPSDTYIMAVVHARAPDRPRYRWNYIRNAWVRVTIWDHNWPTYLLPSKDRNA